MYQVPREIFIFFIFGQSEFQKEEIPIAAMFIAGSKPNRNFCERPHKHHHAKFSSNWPSSFREDYQKCKLLTTMTDSK
jgi:hypothetical protein